ncbi:MAG: thiamine-phosphate kinase [Candidatus Hadarchaeota archaeon]
MKLKDLGEREILMLAKDICEDESGVHVGIGDDAAAMNIDGKSVVVSTDMLVEKVHFGPDTSPEQVAKKAVVVNLSDLAAMGAEPLGMVFSIGAPRNKDLDFITRLLKGMNSTAKHYGTQIVGGDLNESSQVIVSGTAVGKAEPQKLLLRSGAKPGDFVGVTGTLGSSAAITKAYLKNISLEDWPVLQKASFEAAARVKEGRILSETEGVHSCIDITDGLAANLWQISKMSEVGITVEWSELPIKESVRRFAEEMDYDLEDLVLYGGEDFELLFTASEKAWESLKTKFSEIKTKPSLIGKVEKEEGARIRKNKKIEKLPDRGYEHFS